MVHPCCGSSLKQGTKFLAILSMFLSVVLTILASYFLIQTASAILKNDSNSIIPKEDLEYEDENSFCIESIVPEPLLILYILGFSVFNLFLAIMLFIGAEQENYRVCCFWWKISFVLWIIDIIVLIANLAWCRANISEIVIETAEIFRSVYELWVVKAFMVELKGKTPESACRVVVNME